jgi:integrase
MNKLYNEEIKEQFLNQQYENEATQKTIRHVFYNSYPEEYRLNKDLYNFDQHDIAEIIKNANPHAKSVAKTIGRFIRQYIEWAIDKGLRTSNLNPIDVIPDEQYSNFVDQTRKIHYSLEEFLELVNELENAHDRVLLSLFWNGVIGEQFSEIKNLKFEHIDFNNNRIYIIGREKSIEVDEHLIKFLEKARNENTYYQYNSNTKEFNEKEFLPSEYIFKNIKSPRGVPNETIKTNVIYKRIHTFKELFSRDHLTPNALRQSGMLYEAFLLHNKYGVLGYDQLAEIGEKYDYSTIMNPSSGKPYFNTFLMREFINVENLKDLYNIDAEIKIR